MASEQLQNDYVYSATITKIVDGDSLRCVVDLGFCVSKKMDVRLAGLNAPETRGAENLAGQFVKKKVMSFFNVDRSDSLLIPCVLRSESFKLGKFGRCICQVWHEDRWLNSWLIENRLAWLCDENGSMLEPRDVSRLQLPDQIVAEVKKNRY